MAKTFKLVKLKSSASDYYYTTTRAAKSEKNQKLCLKKYDPKVRKHVDFHEEKIK